MRCGSAHLLSSKIIYEDLLAESPGLGPYCVLGKYTVKLKMEWLQVPGPEPETSATL